MTSPSEPEVQSGVIRRITVEATGGHRELQAIATAVMEAVEKLRGDAAREQQETFNAGRLAARAFIHGPGVINLEGTIKVETEDHL